MVGFFEFFVEDIKDDEGTEEMTQEFEVGIFEGDYADDCADSAP